MLNKKKERELAYVVKIDDIRPIEGADNVELAIVGGWHIMVRKNQFNINDYGVYFEIDSKVPPREPFMFLAGKHFKIKTQKYFKGTVISQGLLMSFSDFMDEYGGAPSWLVDVSARLLAGWDIVEDPIFLTKVLDVTYAVEEDNKRKSSVDKYSKMYQRHLNLFKKYRWLRELYRHPLGKKLLFIFLGKKRDKSGWPKWVVKTDEERCQNMPWLFPDDNQDWIVTEKIDGTSTTFTMKRKKREFYICSRNVVFDKPEKECFYETNVYIEMAEKYNIKELLNEFLNDHKDLDFVTLQGETYGAGVQKRDYSIEGHDFMAFNLIFGYKNGEVERFNPITMTHILDNYDIPCVPVVSESYFLPDTCEELLDYAASEPSKLDGGMREGIVLRTRDGKQSFKAVSNEFLIKYHS